MSVEGFSSKLNADYTELANTYLDHIPVYTETDFKTIEVCLKYFLEKNEVGTGSDELRERVIDIKALLDHPEIYVELEINYNLFKDIIIDRIKSKIKEFETMSPQEKKDYIENFVPFIATLIKKCNYGVIDVNTVCNDFKKEFGLIIPYHPMCTILTRSQKRGLIKNYGYGTFKPNKDKVAEAE